MKDLTDKDKQPTAPPGIGSPVEEWTQEDYSAAEELIPLLYLELERIATAYLEREIDSPKFQTTELVNQAFIRLLDQNKVQWQNRAHFFAFAARVMRQLLIEHARKWRAMERGAEATASLPDLRERVIAAGNRSSDLILLDEALHELEDVDPSKSKLVELKYFAGLPNEEIASVLGIPVSSVKREWTIAKTWLYKYLSERGRGDTPVSKRASRDKSPMDTYVEDLITEPTLQEEPSPEAMADIINDNYDHIEASLKRMEDKLESL